MKYASSTFSAPCFHLQSIIFHFLDHGPSFGNESGLTPNQDTFLVNLAPWKQWFKKKKTMYFIKCCSFNNRFNHNLILNNRFFRAGHLHRTCKVTQAVVIIIAAHRFLRGVHKQRAQILVWPCHGQQQTRNQKLLQQFDLCERTKQSALSVM